MCHLKGGIRGAPGDRTCSVRKRGTKRGVTCECWVGRACGCGGGESRQGRYDEGESLVYTSEFHDALKNGMIFFR